MGKSSQINFGQTVKNSSIITSSNLEATLLEQSIKLNAGSTSVETTV